MEGAVTHLDAMIFRDFCAKLSHESVTCSMS